MIKLFACGALAALPCLVSCGLSGGNNSSLGNEPRNGQGAPGNDQQPGPKAPNLAELEKAIDALVADAEGQEDLTEAYRRVRACETPEELRLMAAHFHDDRPTHKLQSVDYVGGRYGPEYTIGDALFFMFVRRFDRREGYLGPQPPILEKRQNAIEWMRKFNYDIALLTADYARQAKK